MGVMHNAGFLFVAFFRLFFFGSKNKSNCCVDPKKGHECATECLWPQTKEDRFSVVVQRWRWGGGGAAAVATGTRDALAPLCHADGGSYPKLSVLFCANELRKIKSPAQTLRRCRVRMAAPNRNKRGRSVSESTCEQQAPLFTPTFLETLSQEESEALLCFHAAATRVQRPVVRKTVQEAGIRSDVENFTNDPIVIAFKKWIDWNIVTSTSPATGLVVGDTWLDFARAYQARPLLFFVVDQQGPRGYLSGKVHINGYLTELRVDSLFGSVVIKRPLVR